MRTSWQPIVFYGDTYFQCRVEAYGVFGEATSKRKDTALSYALEDLAKKVVDGPPAEIPE